MLNYKFTKPKLSSRILNFLRIFINILKKLQS